MAAGVTGITAKILSALLEKFDELTPTELGYLRGAKGSIQSQIDAISMSGTTEAEYIVKDSWTTSGTKTLSGPMNGFYINNTGNSNLTFVINGLSFTIQAKEKFTQVFDAFTEVVINASGTTFEANVSALKPGSPTPAYAVKDSFGSSANMTKTFVESMNGLVISNDGSSSLTYTINGFTLTLPAGDVSLRYFDPFTSVAITSVVPFRAYAIKASAVVVTPPPDTTAPDNVVMLPSTSISGTSLTLNWNTSSSPDVASYDVYRGSTFLGNTSSTTFNVTGLTVSTSYTFWVKAKDATGNVSSGTSKTETTTAAADTTPPANVASVSTSNVTTSSVTLTWPASASGDVSGYDVYNGSSFVTTVTGLTYNVTGLSALTQYTFSIRARDGSGNVATGTSASPVTTSAVADTTPPTVNISPAAGTYTSTQSVTFSSSDNSGGAVTIYYTTDGSTPTQSSSVYSSAISVPATATIKFFGKDSAGNMSGVQTAAYTINTPTGTGLTALKGTNAVDYTKVGAAAQTRKVTVPDAVMNEAAYTKVVYVYSGAINVTTGNFNIFSSSNAVMWIVDGVFTGGHGSAYTAFNTGVTVTQNTWYHVVQAFDGTTMKYYINGIERFSGAASVPSSQTDIEIGAYNGNFEWSAYIAGAWIYNRALTPTEITDHSTGTIATSGLLGEWKFEEGTGTTSADTSGNNNTATLGAGMLWKNVTTV